MPEQTTSWDLTPLVLDFIEWVAREPRSYADVMDAWKTSCPRLTVWEECIERDLVRRDHNKRLGAMIVPTETGIETLARHGRPTCGHRVSAKSTPIRSGMSGGAG